MQSSVAQSWRPLAPIAAGRVEPLAAIVGPSRHGFYSDETGLHYAEARYLLYYLQEKELLVSFYRRFSGGADCDATGRAALEGVLGQPLATLEPAWETFVLGLTYVRETRR